MATVQIIDERTIRISAAVQDALKMIAEAESNLPKYAQEILTIYMKMPVFEFVHFCFYAYNSAELFEQMLGMDPRRYTSFSLDAPDAFFYTLYGGMAALSVRAREMIES